MITSKYKNIREYNTIYGTRYQVVKTINGKQKSKVCTSLPEALLYRDELTKEMISNGFDYPLTFIETIFGKDVYHKPSSYIDIEYVEKNFDENIKYLLETLNEREQEIINKRMIQGYTLEAVGKQYNITRERVRQIEAKAIRKIRLPQRIVYLTEGKKVLELKQDISKLKVELNNIKRELLNQIKKPELIELNEDERILLDNNQPISILDLSVRTHNALLRSGINTVGKLLQCSYLDLCRVRNMGNKSRKEIIEKLKGEGLKLKGEN
jgi:RNA polymerase primary sigma factor